MSCNWYLACHSCNKMLDVAQGYVCTDSVRSTTSSDNIVAFLADHAWCSLEFISEYYENIDALEEVQ